jgi:hypothetical protein
MSLPRAVSIGFHAALPAQAQRPVCRIALASGSAVNGAVN